MQLINAFAIGDASKLYVGASKVLRKFLFVEGGYLMLVDWWMPKPGSSSGG